MISEVEEDKLRLRLFEAGAPAAFPVEQIPTSSGVDIVSGLFAVPHSENEDCLIMDRGPQNSRERRLQWLQLPLGLMLTRVILDDTCSLRGSGYDISTFFLSLRSTSQDCHTNVLAGVFWAEDGRDLDVSPTSGTPACFFALAWATSTLRT